MGTRVLTVAFVGNNLRHDTDERVGATIRALRTVRRLPLKDLAQAIGVNPAHLGNIEAGRRRLTTELADALAEALDIDVLAITSVQSEPQSSSKDSTYLTLEEVATRLRVSRRTVNNLVAAGQLSALRVQTRLRIDRDSFDRYVGAQQAALVRVRRAQVVA
ncbi:helix-turn-helix domain-containing protein [Nocardia sp. NPDC051052]|uniref:helix-turn-helix domain-containing protein n=1 Tax=Nocardia sp. NPDC051052 TaxID=3364322 RepID=UPI0037AA3098